jgi:hypothetical protein
MSRLITVYFAAGVIDTGIFFGAGEKDSVVLSFNSEINHSSACGKEDGISLKCCLIRLLKDIETQHGGYRFPSLILW